MSLRALRTFVAIARHGSFARAGDAVGLTQSAVSLHVRALEEEFGASLFDRSRRRPALTDAGQAVLDRAREILALYDGIRDAIAAPGALTGTLRLGAIQTVLAGHLPDALAALARTHPELHVRVSSGMSAELAALVETGELDAAIITGPARPPGKSLAWTELHRDPFWVVAPPDAQGATARAVLESLPFLRFDRRAWAGRMIEDGLRRQRIRVRDEMELDSRDAILLMVSRGLGAAILPLPEAEAGRFPPVRLLPFGRPQLERPVGLLERAGHPRQRATRALAETMAAAARVANDQFSSSVGR